MADVYTSGSPLDTATVPVTTVDATASGSAAATGAATATVVSDGLVVDASAAGSATATGAATATAVDPAPSWMTDWPRDHLSAVHVEAVLAAEHGYLDRWGVDVLHADTFADTGISLDLIGGEVSWAYRVSEQLTGGTPSNARVRRTATIRCRELDGFNWLSPLYRPWIELRSPHSPYPWVRFHLGVFTATMPPLDDDGKLRTRTLELADRTHLYHSRELTDVLVVTKNTDVLQWISDDLQLRFREPNLSVWPDAVLLSSDDLVFDAGTSRLGVYNALLEHVGYEPLVCDQDGRPTSRLAGDPADRDAWWQYPSGSTVLIPASMEAVNPELPNVVVFTAARGPSLPEEGNGIRTVVNENGGPGSITQRGGRQVTHRVTVEAKDQAELDAIARYRAQYLFAGGGWRAKVRIGLNPAHGDQDVVYIEKPRLGVAGNWLVTAWTLPLGSRTSESAATMTLDLEHLTGTVFVSDIPPSLGAYGTEPFGVRTFGDAEEAPA